MLSMRRRRTSGSEYALGPAAQRRSVSRVHRVARRHVRTFAVDGAGDLGAPAAAKFDIEAWFPSDNQYRETHSTSNCTDFQARRLDIRYKNKTGKLNFVHTVNGTVFSQRPITAIIENYQTKEGTVNIPKVLTPYFDKLKC